MPLALPLLVICSLLVKVTSPGPIVFRQKRVGKSGHVFEILKFRSMDSGAEMRGPAITKAGDIRVNFIGAFLRRTKLDELPQIWNVLKGDMSLVGPRPEVPKYVALYSEAQRVVLSVRPGVTDASSIRFRHEETLLAEQADPEKFYVEELMPRKLEINSAYVQNLSFWHDLHLISRTIVAALKLRPDTTMVNEDFQV